MTLVREESDLVGHRELLAFDDGVRVNVGEFLREVEGFASYLSDVVRVGDRVAMMLGNVSEFMVAALATVGVRGAFVALNPASTPREITTIVDDSKPVVLVTDSIHIEELTELLSDTTIQHFVVVGPDEPRGLGGYRSERAMTLDDLVCDPSDLVSIQYTSGTSGTPKGCQYGHGSWLKFLDTYLRCFGLEEGDRFLYPVPFFYEDAFWQLLGALRAGSTMVTTRKFSASRFWDTIRDLGVTQVYAGGGMPGMLLAQQPSPRDRDHDVKFVSGVEFPAAIQPELLRRWGVPWLELYGLTEAGILTAMPLDLFDEMIGEGSIGLPCPDVDLRILSEDGDEAPSGDEGEIVIPADTPGIMRGYLHQPGATGERFQDGWFHTGDIGRKDEQGFVYFVRRAKDVIRRSSQNISIAEVETVLRSHPLVADAAVLPEPDDIRGEEVRAFVQPADGAAELTERALVEFCVGQMATYKIPRYVQFLHDFPRGPTFRAVKSDMAQIAQDAGVALWDRVDSLGW